MAIPGPGKVEYLPPAGWNTQVSGKGSNGIFKRLVTAAKALSIHHRSSLLY